MLNKGIGVAIFEVGDQDIIFVNNFNKVSLQWAKINDSLFTNSFIISLNNPEKSSEYMISMGDIQMAFTSLDI